MHQGKKKRLVVMYFMYRLAQFRRAQFLSQIFRRLAFAKNLSEAHLAPVLHIQMTVVHGGRKKEQ